MKDRQGLFQITPIFNDFFKLLIMHYNSINVKGSLDLLLDFLLSLPSLSRLMQLPYRQLLAEHSCSLLSLFGCNPSTSLCPWLVD